MNYKRIISALLLATLAIGLIISAVFAVGLDDTNSKVLLHCDGTDGSTAIYDESEKAWATGGNAQIDTAQSVFGGASCLFDGNGDYIIGNDHDDFYLGGGSDSNEWTIDFRVRFATNPASTTQGLVEQWTDTNNYWTVYLTGNNLSFRVRNGGTVTVSISNAWTPSANTWYHVAVVKQGTTGYKMFINGSQIGTTQTDVSLIPNLAGNPRIGDAFLSAGTSNYFNGWIDEFRLSHVARWTGNFTPPGAEYAPTPTTTLTSTITFTPSLTPTITDTPSLTPTLTPTITDTPTITPTHTATLTITHTPTETFTPSQTYTPSVTFTPSLTATVFTSTPVTPAVTIVPKVTYGEYAITASLSGLCLVIITIIVIVIGLYIGERNRRK